MKTPSIRKLTLSLAGAILIASQGVLSAQLGHNNPTGVAGDFNGTVTTGCSYDPYTGNASRSITDIVVPGAVGTYPLAFTRRFNTRVPATVNTPGLAPFGLPGGWRHSYQWEVSQILEHFNCTSSGAPSEYTVIYPDGRQVTFDSDGAPTEPGIGDRFIPIDTPQASTGNCYLLLRDGGRVHFTVEITRDDCHDGGYDAEFVFGCAGIEDPFGQETTMAWTTETVFTIKEPAGRNLSLCWVQWAVNGGVWVIGRVEERAYPDAPVSRTVEYIYENLNNTPALKEVRYFDDPLVTAHYTYQNSNATGNPQLIRTCDDSMYSGPMSKIAYDFAPGRPHGFLQSERYFNGTVGPAVSTLSVPNDDTRIETRGDGPSRTFTYVDGLLKTWTDFQGHTSSQDHDSNGFVSYVRDARGYQTDFVHNPITGNVTHITYPSTPSDEPPGSRWPVTIGYSDGPYHMTSRTDERQQLTIYDRDGNNRVEDITYPDFHQEPNNSHTHERFVHNDFGQVKRHQRKNGKYVHSEYDTLRGLLLHRWNPTSSPAAPATPSTVLPKTSFTYYPLGHVWQDRVQTVTDPRGEITSFEYDKSPPPEEQRIKGRGLLTRITYPGDKFVSFGYDRCANMVWQENELRQRTIYQHDDYNRVTFISTPLPIGNATTQFSYNLVPVPDHPTVSPYLHTSQSVTKITNPSGIVTQHRYDAHFRRVETLQGLGTSDYAMTKYDFDEVGNLTAVTDPRDKVTTMEYDGRNRRTKVIGPPMENLQNGQYVTEWFYDPASNIRKVIQPDDTEILSDYDNVNRLLWKELLSADHQEQRRTYYTYWPSGRLKTLKDPKNQTTEFWYEERDLKTKMKYPGGQIVEGWNYDENGNITERPTAGGPKQFFTYDNRNRLEHMRWSNGIDFSDFGYDNAGRLDSAVNPYSAVTRYYDVGGRLEWERQVLTATFNTPEITITPIEVVSRKTHGSVGSFDISLPLTGTPGIECRNGPDNTLILTFANPVTVGGATVNSGIGKVTTVNAYGNMVTIHLSDVSNAQVLTVRVFGLSDGTNAGELTIPIHVLNGDTTADGVVNSDDSLTTDSLSGQDTDGSNFRSDVNADGVVNGEDAIKVTTTAGTDGSVIPNATGSVQVNVSYSYRADGRRTALYVPTDPAIPDYNFTYTYDGMGRLKSIFKTNFAAEHYQYTYDRSSNVIARTSDINDTSLSYVHDEINRITYESMFLGGGFPFLNVHYEYDRMSRLTVRQPYGGLDDTFAYHFTGELKSADYGLHPNDPDGFIYDGAGNRTSVNGVPYLVDNYLNQYNAAEGNPVDNGNQHEISSFEGINYYYLADTQLAFVSSTAAGNVPANLYQLGHDALGRTVRRTTNGIRTYLVYDGAHSILEFGESGTSTTLYGLRTDEILKRNNNGDEQFFMQDRQGSTLAVTGPKGRLVEQYRYDAFGMPEIMDENGTPRQDNRSAINNRFLFNGREWVPRFGFYENRARAYHPGLGRFMSEDPLGFAGGDANLFRYCGNDPMNRTDPSGMADPKSDDGSGVIKPIEEIEKVTVTGAFVPGADDSWRDLGRGMVLSFGTFATFGGRTSFHFNSTGFGRSAAVPQSSSTQGYWTYPDGVSTFLPAVSDTDLAMAMNTLFTDKLSGVDVPNLTGQQFFKLMKNFDTIFHHAFATTRLYYTGGIGGSAGVYYGSEINYIGVGGGFRARGESRSEMLRDVIAWKVLTFGATGGLPHGHELNFAWAGYDFYPFWKSWHH